MNKIKAKKSIPTCPVKCKYCMAQKIDIRTKYWKNINRIGVNKSCVFFNKLPQDPKIEDMNFPWHLLDGEYLGFQGITDCFWDIFNEDLKYIVKKVKNSNIRKLCLISKIPISDEQIQILYPIKDKLIVCYSITGLDELENTKTKDRIKSLMKLREYEIDVLPVMHPYIHGYTKAEEIFKELNENGFKEISWKGFRYNSENMKELKNYISNDILEKYEANENEILLGEKYLEDLSKKYNLIYWDLKDYLHKEPKNSINLSQETIEKEVNELLKECVFSTSSSKEEVREYCIKRRKCM